MTSPNTPQLPQLPPRKADSHKGDYGHALLIGGSRGMSGAVALAGLATLRSGAGLVTIATADACLDTVAAIEPSYMTAGLPCDTEGRIAAAAADRINVLAKRATAIGFGPGIGRSEDLAQLVSQLYVQLTQPVVFDADALFAIAQNPSVLSGGGGPRILTPHQGEFARLLNGGKNDRNELEAEAVDFAQRHELIVVLKGHQTLVTDGARRYHNPTGNPGMATGGCGDVLTGVITALLCQGLDAFDAATLGVYVHGLAGDLAARRVGETSLIARDLVETLPEAFAQQQP
jgi:ADP-dependent NAD(P)H-hydrate dehydratase